MAEKQKVAGTADAGMLWMQDSGYRYAVDSGQRYQIYTGWKQKTGAESDKPGHTWRISLS